MRIFVFTGKNAFAKGSDRNTFLSNFTLWIDHETYHRKPDTRSGFEFPVRVLRNKSGPSGISLVLHLRSNTSLKRPFTIVFKGVQNKVTSRTDVCDPLTIGLSPEFFQVVEKKFCFAQGLNRFHNKKFVKSLGKHR